MHGLFRITAELTMLIIDLAVKSNSSIKVALQSFTGVLSWDMLSGNLICGVGVQIDLRDMKN